MEEFFIALHNKNAQRQSMENKRWSLILANLNENTPTTSAKLAEIIGVSDRTIRNELKKLKDVLEKEGAQLISKTNSGYVLQVNDSNTYQKFIQSLLRQENMPSDSTERIQYLLEILLANGKDYVKLDDLCDQLFVSRAVLTQNLNEVRKLLSNYNLRLVSKPHYGIRVEGKEFDLRLCLAEYVISRTADDVSSPKQTLEEIADCIQKGLADSGLKISDVSYQNLVIHIYIALKRINMNYEVNMSEEQLLRLQNESEYKYAYRIAEEVEKKFKVKLSESEIAYITIHLASKRIIENSNNNENTIVDEEIIKTVDEMMNAIKDNYNISFFDDFELRMMLATHLIPLSVRLEYDMNMKNPLLKDIKQRYTLAYMMASTACEVIEKKYQKTLLDDEIGYFALHFNLALERRKSNIENKKNILVVCSTGRGSAQMLGYNIKNEFGKYLNEISTCDVLDLEKQNLDNIDYIFTTVPINISVNRPIIYIKYFLDDSDVKNIENILSDDYTVANNYFDEQLFIPNMQASTKEEVIHQMVKHIKKVKNIPDHFEQDVLDREHLASTDFGNNVAIPHPNKVLDLETFVTIAILKKPILWEKEKVQFVFMLALGKQDAGNIEEFQRIVSKLLFSKTYINELIKNPSYETFMKFIQQIRLEKK